MYEELFNQSSDEEFISVYGQIMSLKSIKKSTIEQFFIAESKIFTSHKNPDKNLFLPKRISINEIKKIDLDMANAQITTVYADDKKQDEDLILMLDGSEWKIMLPAPYMRIMIAALDHYKK